MTRGLLIAAPRSGAGKTTVTLGLLGAFRANGTAIRGAKSGPDYIDGAFHQAATGRPSFNLDSWAMPPGLLRALASGPEGDRSLLLVEAAMGLFDGGGVAGPGGADGSAASLARILGLPVLLVLDVSGQGQSAAAVALGFRLLDPTLNVGGVILNRIGSVRHQRRVEQAMRETAIPVLGALGRHEALLLPERHLGLVQAGEHADVADRLDRIAAAIRAGCDLDRIAALAAPPDLAADGTGPALPPPGLRIALAADAAFSFVYPHMIEGWRREGATILPFSPLADETPDPTADAVWLPGGYPELHAGRLAAAGRFRDALARFALGGGTIHGECGGYMVLGRMLEDAEGVRHPMLGLLDHATSFRKRALHLGYRTARLLSDGALGRGGDRVSGHEFHHATLIEPGSDAPLAELSDGDFTALGAQGGARLRVTGGFFHAIARA